MQTFLMTDESLSNVDILLGRLSESKKIQWSKLIFLFSDGFFFFLMHLFERYIDMGDGQPIWHCFCRFSPEKHEQLESEVKHMLENYIAVPSCKAGPHHVYW